jgi:hypothetical protein
MNHLTTSEGTTFCHREPCTKFPELDDTGAQAILTPIDGGQNQ